MCFEPVGESFGESFGDEAELSFGIRYLKKRTMGSIEIGAEMPFRPLVSDSTTSVWRHTSTPKKSSTVET